jgi:hypothetical protein
MIDVKEVWNERNKKAKERLEICNSCEHLDKTMVTCKKCGCFMKLKTLFPDSKCPEEKWNDYKETN